MQMSKSEALQIEIEENKYLVICGAVNKNGIFSNLYKSPFELKGKKWMTVEHYFQSQKFAGTEMEELIRRANTPTKANTLGIRKSDKYPIRADWEEVKEDIMYEAIKAKFEQNSLLMLKLLSTKNYKIIELTHNNPYWSFGKKGKGKNKFGILLMKLREEFNKEEKYIKMFNDWQNKEK